jgi:hypothetical protein
MSLLILPMLAWNCDPTDLSLLPIWDDNHGPSVPGLPMYFILRKQNLQGSMTFILILILWGVLNLKL